VKKKGGGKREKVREESLTFQSFSPLLLSPPLFAHSPFIGKLQWEWLYRDLDRKYEGADGVELITKFWLEREMVRVGSPALFF